MNHWAWAHLDPHKCKVSIGPNTPIVLRPMNGEELLSSRKRVKSRKKRSIYSTKSPKNLVISELQFKSAATYFLLRAITPAPENYH
jgi:hypothetical protein